MKTKFNNQQLAHVWAQQTQSEGRGSSMYFNGATIYSYGEHFPCGVIVNGIAVLNADSYSSTTNKHQAYTRRAVSHMQRIYINTHTIKAVARVAGGWDNWKDNIKHEAEKWIAYKILQAAQSAATRRKPELRERDINEAISAYNQGAALLALYKLKLSAKIHKQAKTLETNLEAILAANKKAIEAAKRKQAKEAKEREARQREAAEKAAPLWLAHGEDYEHREALRHRKDALLRVSKGGLLIETSHGAQFPIEQAKSAFLLIRECREKGFSFNREAEQSQLGRLGNFRIDSISAAGDVVAGCHTVKWDAIEHCARVLNIYP